MNNSFEVLFHTTDEKIMETVQRLILELGITSLLPKITFHTSSDKALKYATSPRNQNLLVILPGKFNGYYFDTTLEGVSNVVVNANPAATIIGYCQSDLHLERATRHGHLEGYLNRLPHGQEEFKKQCEYLHECDPVLSKFHLFQLDDLKLILFLYAIRKIKDARKAPKYLESVGGVAITEFQFT